MKRLCIISFLLVLSFEVVSSQEIPLDSILIHMKESAAVHVKNTPDYESIVYIRGNIGVQKRNFLLKMIPKYYRVASDTGVAGSRKFEMLSDLTFTNPDKYSQRIMDINYDNEILMYTVTQTVFPYIHGNVYSSMLYEMLYSPIAKHGKRYYKYSVDASWKALGHTFVKLSFKPMLESYKLVSGYMVINADNWSIRELYFEGRTEFMRFSNTVRMGSMDTEYEFMATSMDFKAQYHFLGNKLSGDYKADITYFNIQKSFVNEKHSKPEDKSGYDLSVMYTSTYDTLLRPFFLHRDTVAFVDTLPKVLTEKEIRKKQVQDRWSKFGTFIVSDNSVNMSKNGRLEFSPIISPVLFNYSSREGISYAQKLSYKKDFTNDRQLMLSPMIGFNFKEGSFHWYLNGEYVYNPRKNAKVYVDFSQGDRIFTDEVQLELDALPEVVFDSEKLHLDVFRSTYFKAGWGHEVVNGLTIGALFGVYNYTAVPRSEFVIINPSSKYIDEAKSIARNSYTSFVPEVRLSWTPGQYHYYKGNRKVNLYSYYPTISLSWAYAIKGVLNSDMTYQRTEIDVQHQVSMGLLSDFSYRLGIGGFFNYEKLYFSDFWNFRRNNLPVGWDDEIGGDFQLLDTHRYNSVTKYIRGHLKLDVPFILTTTILRDFPLIMKERFYFNALFSPELQPWFEVGYGLGTYAFDIGVFWGGELDYPNKFGIKFTLNLH